MQRFRWIPGMMDYDLYGNARNIAMSIRWSDKEIAISTYMEGMSGRRLHVNVRAGSDRKCCRQN